MNPHLGMQGVFSAQTQDQTNNVCCVILWPFFDKNGHSVSHQFYFSGWRATLVARIQNANDVVNLAFGYGW